MKAQSELAGDRERRAEMTRPRFGGVTNWMDSINEMNKAFDFSGITAGIAAFADTIGTIPAIATPASDIMDDTIDNEVSLSPCRPATDGMHSVNSAEVC